MSAVALLVTDHNRILEVLLHELGHELQGQLTNPKMINTHSDEDGSILVNITAGTEVDAEFRLATVVSAELPALAA